MGGNQRGRVGKGRAQALDFSGPAARHHRDYFARADAKRGANAGRVDSLRRFAGFWVTDEYGIDAQRLVKRRLERQDAQYGVRGPGDLFATTRTPGPDRRANVVCCAHAGFAQCLFETEIEVGRIDADEDIGRRGFPAAHEITAQAQQARDVPQWFYQAHNGK